MSEKFRKWFFACRPWSLTASFVPFAVCAPLLVALEKSGSAGLPDGSWVRFSLALFSACLLQIACNLLNSWGDYVSGVDLVDGAFVSAPQLVDGKISARAMLAAGIGLTVVSAAIAFFIALAPSVRGQFVNLPLIVAALAGVLGASNYTTGFRFKYRGLGLPFVFILMGPLYFIGVGTAFFGGFIKPADIFAAGGAACALRHTVATLALYSVPIGLLVACIMHGNDMRDIRSDAEAGIKTASTMLGPAKSLLLYKYLHLSGVAAAVILVFSAGFDATREIRAASRILHLLPSAIPLLALPPVVATLKRAAEKFNEKAPAPEWRGLERDTGKIHFLLGLLYTAGLFAAATAGA